MRVYAPHVRLAGRQQKPYKGLFNQVNPFKFSCPGEEQAGDEAGTRDQRREDAHEGDAAAGDGASYAG